MKSAFFLFLENRVPTRSHNTSTVLPSEFNAIQINQSSVTISAFRRESTFRWIAYNTISPRFFGRTAAAKQKFRQDAGRDTMTKCVRFLRLATSRRRGANFAQPSRIAS
jgi:hypothetical protein